MHQIGRYQIRNEIGRGGMAIVYRALDPRFEREVAIKLLPRQFSHDPDFLGRFQSEAKIIAALEHPAIVPVYDFGEHDDAPYLVMRYMAGGSLQDRLQGRPLPLTETSRIFDRLAPALDKAHQRGIIHRDLKPANVFFDEDDLAFLGDFGIARMAEATQTMTIIGTPAYMSPEQAEGSKKLDWRCDIYALGVMLFEMLTGRQPYEAETATGQMLMHVLQPVPDVLAANPELPPECQNIINQTMAKERAFRYPTAEAMAEDIRRLLPQPQVTGVAIAGVAMAGAATMIESPQMATVVDSAPYPATRGATDLDSSPQFGQTAVPTTPQQPAAAPDERKGGSGCVWAVAALVVFLLLFALGAGYVWFFGGGEETIAAFAAPQAGRESAAVAAQVSSPTASATPTDLPTATPIPNASETPTETQEPDGDGDGVVGAEDACPALPGPATADGCPATQTPAPASGPQAAEMPASSAKPMEPITFDLPPEISRLLSDAEVIFHDDFAELSSSNWREAGDYQTVDGLLELTDTAECLGRMEGLTANTAVLVHFSYEDVPQSDFEMFFNNDTWGSVDYRQWGTRLNGEIPTIHVVRKRSTIEDSALDGDLSLNPDTWYELLLAVDQDAEFVAQLWESDDPATYAEYRTTLEEWADQEWYGAFCNARGSVFVDTYSEIVFNEILPAAVAEAPPSTTVANQTQTPQSTSSSNQTGAASQGDGLPMGFESFGTWRRGDQDNGSFTQSGEQAHSGGNSAKLSYDFPSTDNDYVVFLQLNDISGSPDALQAWVYGDGVGHYLNAWVLDSDGQTWQVPLGNISHTGWKQVTGRIATGQDWPWTHISGPDNGQVDYPLTFRAFVLDDVNAGYSGSGEIFIDDLSAVTIGGGPAPGSGPANTPSPTAEAGGTSSPGPTTAASSGPLDFSYLVEWQLDPQDDNNAIASVALYPRGGDGNYSYYQDDSLRPGSHFEFNWRACKPYPGSFRVDSGDGQSIKKDVWEKAPCPDEG